MKQKKCKIREGIGLSLYLLVAITLFSCFIGLGSSAGFGSSYIPKINNVSEIDIEVGHNVSYFVYPQNFDNKTLLVKINLTDINGTLLNSLNDVYEIPPNTSSDDFKIEMIFGLANNTALINQSFFVSYAVLSTFKDENTSAVVSFSPIGYTKTFYVKGIDRIVIPIIVNQTNTTQTNQTEQEHSHSSSTSSTSSTNTTKKSTTTNIITPTPTTQTPTPKQTTPIQQTPTPLTVVPTSNFLSKIFNIWTGIIFMGLLAIIFIIFIAKKIIGNRGNNGVYKNYSQGEYINEQ